MNIEKPLITIIIPVYNVEKYLDKCIKSVINQLYKNLQIILIDDNSTDKSSFICDYYAKFDKRIEVIHKENNEGLSEARNLGIKIAKGKYIGFVDSDDYIERTMYLDLLDYLIKYNADVGICNFYNVIDGKKVLKNNDVKFKIYNRIDILKEILLDRNIQSYAWNKIYKKELFDRINYPKGRKYEDIGTTFYILEQCNKVISINKPEYYYLNRKDSIVNTVEESTIIDYLEIVMERFNYIKEAIPELNKYNNYYLMKILIILHKDLKKIKNKSVMLNKIVNKFHESIKENIGDNVINIKDLCIENELSEMEKIMVEIQNINSFK